MPVTELTPPEVRPLPALEDRLQFLQDAASHAGHAPGCGQVETIETHMSWVFLAGGHALKMKKSVLYPFLDFSTLQAREMHCREEARINARLAPNVYLGLMALQWDGRHFMLRHESALADQAQTLDWLVLMRRLPHGRMLDQRIAAQSVSREEIDALAQVLSTFYRGATTSPVGSVEYLGRWRREHQTNRQVLERPRFRLPGATEALDRFEAALAGHRALLVRRVRAGRIVEGHGDLRPEHVCLLHPPVVIDALEFNASMRQIDVFDELAFFGLECEMAGASWIGPRVVAACAKALDDEPTPALMAIYTAGRALLRARLSMAHLLEPRPREPWRWEPQAARYLERARRALDALDVLGSMGNPGGSARELPARPVPGRAPGAVVRAAPGGLSAPRLRGTG